MKPRRVKVVDIRSRWNDRELDGIHQVTVAYVIGWGPWQREHRLMLWKRPGDSHTWYSDVTGRPADPVLQEAAQGWLIREVIRQTWEEREPQRGTPG